jgi:epsilon-lactone hydrolase
MASQELQVVLELLRGIDLDAMSFAERRSATASLARAPAGTQVEPADAGGVPSEWVTPAGVAGDRVIMYLHGGAYQIGSPATLRHLVALLSASAQARAFSVDYRLAPEHPFPPVVDDAVVAYRWLLAAGHDPASVAITGDSAGGGLTLATLVALRDAGDADVLLKPAGMAQTAALYLAGADPRHPYASPLYADLHGLPPILIQAGDAEVILDDSTRFAARARAAGVEVTLNIWDEMPHVFQAFAGLLPEADEAVAQIGSWLREHVRATC